MYIYDTHPCYPGFAAAPKGQHFLLCYYSLTPGSRRGAHKVSFTLMTGSRRGLRKVSSKDRLGFPVRSGFGVNFGIESGPVPFAELRRYGFQFIGDANPYGVLYAAAVFCPLSFERQP